MIKNFKIFLTLYGKDIKKWVNIAERFDYLDGFELYEREDINNLLKNKEYLKDLGKNYEFSMHAPYAGLSFPAMNRNLKKITINIFRKTIEFARSTGVKNIVFHGNYNYIYFIEDDFKELFLWKLSKFMKEFIIDGLETQLSFENVFETKPEYFFNFIEGIRKIYDFKYCIDTGHLNFLSNVPMEKWYSYFDENLREVHLHDNDGNFDQHLYPGGGNIDFGNFFKNLIDKKFFPQITLELHKIEHIETGLRKIKEIIEKAYNKKEL
ncbi:sugar phosphate isomerase/epimerase [bacterium]|nr:sugar phosphate isomerase/epimerase [bacterium]